MLTFENLADAMEFVIAQIIWQAEWEDIPFSEVERRMLYFEEKLPGMSETNELFERDYDEQTYEQKVARLMLRVSQRLRTESNSQLRAWLDALTVIKKSDRYLAVLADVATSKARPPGDLWKLWGTGLGICALIIPIGLLLSRFEMNLNGEAISFAIWAIAVISALALMLGSKWARLQRKRKQ